MRLTAPASFVLRPSAALERLVQVRATAIARIWTSIQRLSPDGAPPASDVAPAKESRKKPTARTRKRRTAPNGAKSAKGKVKERRNKKVDVLAMMKQARAQRSPRS